MGYTLDEGNTFKMGQDISVAYQLMNVQSLDTVQVMSNVKAGSPWEPVTTGDGSRFTLQAVGGPQGNKSTWASVLSIKGKLIIYHTQDNFMINLENGYIF